MEKQDITLFSQMFFHRDEFPMVCDYSKLLEQYSNFLSLFLDSNYFFYYKNMSYLELVVDAFEYCHDFYFPKPEEIDYQGCGEQILNQVAMWKKNQVDTFSSDEVVNVLSWACSFELLHIHHDSVIHRDDVLKKVIGNCYRVSSVIEDVNDTTKRRM